MYRKVPYICLYFVLIMYNIVLLSWKIMLAEEKIKGGNRKKRYEEEGQSSKKKCFVPGSVLESCDIAYGGHRNRGFCRNGGSG